AIAHAKAEMPAVADMLLAHNRKPSSRLLVIMIISTNAEAYPRPDNGPKSSTNIYSTSDMKTRQNPTLTSRCTQLPCTSAEENKVHTLLPEKTWLGWKILA